MKRPLAVLALVGLLVLVASPASAAGRVRATVADPTCANLAFRVSVTNGLDHTVRVEAVLHTEDGPDITAFHVHPGQTTTVRIPVAFTRLESGGTQRGWSLTAVRSSWANFQKTGWGWLADGYAYLGWSC